MLCPSCGSENRDRARFCDSCAAALTAPTLPREQRKTVTVLFCDVAGSTALGEKLDPEALRLILARYFERMKAIVEYHGGTVEKFIGDAVMAVFGVPVLHEDDALRALRAALEMRDAFPELGIEGRIGVMTGEVVTGTEERLATGDAVNVAARLEQAAEPGEILIGDETYRLTRDAAVVDVLEPRTLKGKAGPVAAHRLIAVHGSEGFLRNMAAPMVGRSREQRQLASVWERTTSERSCQLFTVLGAAGVGKSRLAAEFLASLDDTLVVRGRCLPYGEGITYWPVVEVAKQLPGVDLDPAAAETVGALVGNQRLVTSSAEIAWAFRKQLEAVARAQPLVCVFDDLHWGESTFLDLVEHVADLSRDAPILLLCMARPDLLDRRTGWGGGKVNATTVLLEPLAPSETALLIQSLAPLDEHLQARIQEAAEGNPLFVEEMVGLLQQSDDAEVVVPPTIQALLAARLDQLDPGERNVLQCGAVEGRTFHQGAIRALDPAETESTARLTALVRKELIRPDTALFPHEEAFRFRHLLSRDAAYDALPKATRAELHERYAAWLDEHGGDLVELDEMLGYHFEQAARYNEELGRPSATLAALAATRLGAAGRRALDRGDMVGAINLLERARTLFPAEDDARIALELELGKALQEAGRLVEAEALLEQTVARAARSNQPLVHRRAQLGLVDVRIQTRGEGEHPQLGRELALLAADFERAGDHRDAANALRLLGVLSGTGLEAAHLHERARAHAHEAGDERLALLIARHIAAIALWGPEPVETALARCREILAEASSNASGLVQASCLMRIGGLLGLAGEFEDARATIAEARAIMDDLGLRHQKAHSTDVAVLVEMLAEDYEAAEREASHAYAVLEAMGDLTYQASEGLLIAAALERQERTEEAEQWLATSNAVSGSADDPDALVVQARLLARRGLLQEAIEVARSALDGGAELPVPSFSDARFTLAEILHRAGREEEAAEAAARCLERYEAKGIVPLVQKAKALLAEIRA
jgi:class 3 adenylate cyclase/tetratricopeptide (TPR) repeat protein